MGGRHQHKALVTGEQGVSILEEKSGREGVDNHVEALTRRQQCRHKDLLSEVGPKAKTSERYDGGAHLREGIKRAMSRY